MKKFNTNSTTSKKKIIIISIIIILASAFLPLLLTGTSRFFTYVVAGEKPETFTITSIDGNYFNVRSNKTNAEASVRFLGVDIVESDEVLEFVGKTIELKFDRTLGEYDEDGYLQAYLFEGDNCLQITALKENIGVSTISSNADMWQEFYVADVSIG